MVHPVCDLLAAGLAGPDCVPVYLAASTPIPDRGSRRAWRARDYLSGNHTSVSLAGRPFSNLTYVGTADSALRRLQVRTHDQPRLRRLLYVLCGHPWRDF